MREYLSLVEAVLDLGEERTDRTGVGTLSMFGLKSCYDLRRGFPLVTTKKVLFDAVVRELLWMLSGSTNIRENLAQHTPIWDAWANEDGELGPVYGHQWRAWGGVDRHDDLAVDQIAEVIRLIKTDPTSRRILVSAWNVADLPAMALPPCHVMFQFYVSGGQWLDCQLYQRSADLALGVPFNVASYALLTSMVANECGLKPRYFDHVMGDVHVYTNHVDGLRTQLARTPYELPTVCLRPGLPVLDTKFEDIELVNYQHHPFIRFEVAV